MSIVGIALGTIMGALLQVRVAYTALAAQLLVTGVLFAFLTRDVTRDEPPERAASQPSGSRFPGFRTAPDFWWTFIGRFLAIGAYSVAGGLQLFVEPQLMGLAGPQFTQSDWSPNQMAFEYAFKMGDFGASAALSTLLVGSSIGIALVIVFATRFYRIE